jgi:biopolymer transport protein ExbD
MRVRTEEDEDVSVQMAPLLDCMFLLLIFFLVATTLKKIVRELPIVLPESDAAIEAREEPDTLVLGVDRYGRFYANSVPADRKTLLQEIARAKAARLLVRVDADRSARYSDVVEVIGLCRMRGVYDVKLHVRDDETRKGYLK